MNLVLITITLCALAFTYYVWKFHDKLAERKAEAQLAKWKMKEEKAIREDAYQRSRAVSFGKTIEHYVCKDYLLFLSDPSFWLRMGLGVGNIQQTKRHHN